MQFHVETRSLGKYDIIVAGGGIAGSFAAASAAREGAKVVLIYKKIDRPFDAARMDKNGVDRYYAANAGNTDTVERMLREMHADYLVFESDISEEAAVKVVGQKNPFLVLSSTEE